MTVHYSDHAITLHHGDSLEVLRTMPDASVNCCVTSPPYFGLRDYGEPGQYGLEASPAEYVETMRTLFAEVRRVLANDGTLWLNVGDSYSGGLRGAYDPNHLAQGVPTRRPVTEIPAKNLMGIPWRVAFALQDDGWTLRNDIIWAKPNAMPESVTDRLSTRHEHVFMFSKARSYWFDLDPIREALAYPNDAEVRGDGAGYAWHQNIGRATHMGGHALGRNPGDVWTVPTQPFSAAHFAVMPAALAERCVLSGCKPGGTVLDPFSGSGTTGLMAAKHGRKYVGIDLSRDYLDLSLRTRFADTPLDMTGDAS